MIDIIVIGAGVIGANIARELSKYDCNIMVIEKNADVCEETSKANSGIAHSGYDATPGTLKAKYNVLGNRMLPKLCMDLDVPYVNNGSLILGFSKEDEPLLKELMDQGIQNGVKGLTILSRDEVLKKEPALNPKIYSALYAPTGGIVDPFQLTIASAEVATLNKVTFQLNTIVFDIVKTEEGFSVKTNQGDFETRIIVNAAGTYSDHINNYISKNYLDIRPRKGEYCLFDKQVGSLVHSTIFQLPSSLGKGVLVTPTAEGNLLVGPSSLSVDDKEDKETTIEGIKYILEKASSSVPNIPLNFIITGFAGLRASEVGKDFIIGEALDVPNFYNAAGIESPGLTAAPAIAVEIANLIQKKEQFSVKSNYVTTRKNAVRFEAQSIEGKKALIASDKEYGRIVCRCEMVTLSEIKQAIHRPLGATTVDGVKRRTRAGSGRCQGGFCSPRILEILAKELSKDPTEIAKSSMKSTFLVGLDKEL
jgi:glycerol-3-phosphate dehydrogenase